MNQPDNDAYDEQVKQLTANPELIHDQWMEGIGLFKAVPGCWGCLTQIRAHYEMETSEIGKAIWQDSRLPTGVDEIKPSHLPLFAEWQRRIDQSIAKGQP